MKYLRHMLALLSLVSVLCIAPMHAQDTVISSTSDTIAAELQNVHIQQQEVLALSNELIALCNKLFNPQLMGHTTKSRFVKLMHTLNRQHKTISEVGIVATDCNLVIIKNQLLAELSTLKRLYLKLQLITLDDSEYQHAFLQQKPSPSSFQGMLLINFEILLDAVQKSDLNSCLDNQELAEITYHSLNETLPFLTKNGGLFIRAIPFWEENNYYRYTKNFKQALAIDLFDTMPLFAEKALHFLSAYQTTYLNCEAGMLENHLKQVDQLLDLLPSHNSNVAEIDENTVVPFFTHKLLAIKQKLLFFQKLLGHAEQQPVIAAIFVKHNHLMQSGHFEKLVAYARSKKLTAVLAVIDDYVNLVETFLNDPRPSHLLTYHLDEVRTKIDDARNAINKLSNSWWQLRVWFIKLGGTVDTDSIHALGEMLAVFNLIQEHLPSFATERGQSYMSLIKSIMSGKWFTESTIKQVTQKPDGTVSMNFVDSLLGQKSFPDFRTAATHALMFASPFLLTKLIGYVTPYLSKNTAEHINDTTQLATGDGTTKIIDFASKNPELMNQITKQCPEIITLLSDNLKSLANTGD